MRLVEKYLLKRYSNLQKITDDLVVNFYDKYGRMKITPNEITEDVIKAHESHLEHHYGDDEFVKENFGITQYCYMVVDNDRYIFEEYDGRIYTILLYM